jgi:hypothetical protein
LYWQATADAIGWPLRGGLSTSAGAGRVSVDAAVNSSVACDARPYTVLGIWVVILP